MLLERLNQLPPFVCRLLATKKKGWRAMSIADIAERSGFTPFKVAKIAPLKSWADVSIADAEKFATACGVDLLHQYEAKKRLRESNLLHVQRASKGQRRMFTKMLNGQ